MLLCLVLHAGSPVSSPPFRKARRQPGTDVLLDASGFARLNHVFGISTLAMYRRACPRIPSALGPPCPNSWKQRVAKRIRGPDDFPLMVDVRTAPPNTFS